jgi:hypothetical protein
MASDASKLRAERLAWLFIYGGLLAVVLSIFLERFDRVLADTLQIAGALTAGAGAVLIYVRSRMK